MRFIRPHRSAIAPAILLLACASTARAQAQMQLYGTVDAAVGQIETQHPGPPNAPIVRTRGVHNGGLQTSYFGLRGGDDLGAGYTAFFVLESFLRADIGQPGRFDANPASGADPFWSREALVGLGGPFGELRLGTNAQPAWVSMILTSALGANSVFSPSFRQIFNGGTRGRSDTDAMLFNSVKYNTPVLAGLSGSAIVSAAEGSGAGSNYGASVGYRAGSLFVTAALTRVRHAESPALPGARDQALHLVGGSYDFGAVRLFAQYTTIDNPRLNAKDKMPHLGLTAPVGLGQVQLAWEQDKNTAAGSTTRRTTASGGYVYALSKRTQVYGFAMRDDLPVVGNADSYVLGVRHAF